MSDTRPCRCGRIAPDGEYRPGDCVLCWHAAHTATFRAAWGIAGATPTPPPPAAPCGCHKCPECGPLPEDARPDLAPRRNLLFHLHPVTGSNWRWHLGKLIEHADLFDGRRVVAVTTGDGLDPPDFSRLMLPGFDVVEVPNDPALREVATFEPLFSMLTPDPDEVTLYAQSKAVTHRPEDTAHRWAEVLWEVCCDHWPHALGLLRKHPVAGPFLKEGAGWPAEQSASAWHYSGSWFWFRNADLLGKPDWRRIDRFAHGIEPYPSLHFTLRQAGELFHRDAQAALNLYDWGYLTRVVEPALVRWRIDRLSEANA